MMAEQKERAREGERALEGGMRGKKKGKAFKDRVREGREMRAS